jgi:hypothetical protein
VNPLLELCKGFHNGGSVPAKLSKSKFYKFVLNYFDSVDMSSIWHIKGLSDVVGVLEFGADIDYKRDYKKKIENSGNFLQSL